MPSSSTTTSFFQPQNHQYFEALHQRNQKLAAILQESEETIIAQINDVVEASIFVAEAFAREQIQLEQGKMRDYILYNGGLLDQPTSPITVAEQLPQLENVLATGVGFLVDSGEANAAIALRLVAVISKMAGVVEEERLAAREANANAEAATAMSRVHEMKCRELENKMSIMEKMLIEREEKIQQMLQKQKQQEDEAAEKAKNIVVAVEQEKTAEQKPQNADEEEKEHEKENVNQDSVAISPRTNDDGEDAEKSEQEAATKTPEQKKIELKEEAINNNNNNEKVEKPKQEQQQEEEEGLVSPNAFLNKKNVSPPTTTATASNESPNPNNNNNRRSHSSYEADSQQCTTTICFPRWANHNSNIFAKNNHSSAADSRSASLYPDLTDPNYKPISAQDRKSNILSVLDHSSFAPADLDWGRSVTADPYKQSEKEDAWKNHAPVKEINVSFPAKNNVAKQQLKQQQQQQQYDEHCYEQEKDVAEVVDNNNNSEQQEQQEHFEMPSGNPWANNNNYPQFSTPPSKPKPIVGFENKNDKPPPTGFVHPADLLAQRSKSAGPLKTNSSSYNNNNELHVDPNSADNLHSPGNNNNNNLDATSSSNGNNILYQNSTNSLSRQQHFLLSEHMRSGEAQAVISVASGVANHSQDYAIDTTLDWLVRLSHGPMLQLEQTLLQRDHFEKSPPQSRASVPPLPLLQQQQQQVTSSTLDDKNKQDEQQQKPLEAPTTTEPATEMIQKTPPRGSLMIKKMVTGKPPLSGNLLASPPGKKAPSKFQALTKKIIASNKMAKSPGSPPTSPKSKTNVGGGVQNGSIVNPPPPAPASSTGGGGGGGASRRNSVNSSSNIVSNHQQLQQQKKLSINNSSYDGRHTLPVGGATASASSVSSSQKIKNNNNNNNNNNNDNKNIDEPTSPRLDAANLSKHTKEQHDTNFVVNNNVLANKHVPLHPARGHEELDPDAPPPEKEGQFVETEEEIMEHLERDSNYNGNIVSTDIHQRQQQQMINANNKNNATVLTNGGSSSKQQGQQNKNPAAVTTGVLDALAIPQQQQVLNVAVSKGNNNNNINNSNNNNNNISTNPSSETNSLKQIHSLLGGCQPSVGRPAGFPAKTEQEVEDTTPAPFRRKNMGTIYGERNYHHENTRSEEEYFEQSGGVLHALHRVLSQETKERNARLAQEEKEKQEAILKSTSAITAAKKRSASGNSYYDEY